MSNAKNAADAMNAEIREPMKLSGRMIEIPIGRDGKTTAITTIETPYRDLALCAALALDSIDAIRVSLTAARDAYAAIATRLESEAQFAASCGLNNADEIAANARLARAAHHGMIAAREEVRIARHAGGSLYNMMG